MRTAFVLLLALGCDTEALDDSEQLATTSTIVSLTFDDTLADQAQVATLLSARGMRATFYINSPRLGASGYLTLAQVKDLAQRGNEIGGHTLDHEDLTTLTSTQARTQICNDRVALLTLGFPVTSLAYPFGATNATVESIARTCGYNSARGVGDLVSGTGCQGCPYAERVPPVDPYAIDTPDSIKSTTTLAALETYVTQAEQHGGGWVPIVIHHVCSGCDPDSISAANLTAFLDWLAARKAQGTIVKTVDEVVGGVVQAGSALLDPSLETDANADAVPDCWMRGGTGTNTARYTLVADPFDGKLAQRIDITTFTSGARRLVTAQDTGACAPVVIPGHAYQVSAHYHATTTPRFTIYYRTTGGVWKYFAQSAAFPTSSGYVFARYTTPALPSDAAAISVGLSIYALGSITMDAFSLADATLSDTTPPTAAVTSPIAGATVTGTTTIVATASDNVAVVRVRFYLDGKQLGTRTATPYRWNWDTTTTTKGSHTLAVQAEDAAGNATRSKSVAVTVQ